jgi:TATA-binding protein-associated factor
MAKLGQYNLNCILCDDMGLGKTLQALTVILNESYGQKATHLVVCPSSLTYNWLAEIGKFFTGIKAAVIEGADKNKLLSKWEDYDILIINYEKVKGSLEMLSKISFFYVVLDEAHKIKNSKSVVTQSVNKLNSQRKLALSGTPLQNRVSELWSLFDFIMPEYLEDESTFNKTYNKYLTGNIKRMQEKLEET